MCEGIICMWLCWRICFWCGWVNWFMFLCFVYCGVMCVMFGGWRCSVCVVVVVCCGYGVMRWWFGLCCGWF